MTKLNFNTKVNFNSNTISCRLFNAVENFCYLGGRSFSVLSKIENQLYAYSQGPKYKCHVQEKSDQPSTMMSTALKVILYATIVIPLIMFIAKICLRNYYIFETKDWKEETDGILNLQLKLNQICGRNIKANYGKITEPVVTQIDRNNPLLMSVPEFFKFHEFITSDTTPEQFEDFLMTNNLTNKKPRVSSFLFQATSLNNLPLVKHLVEKKSTVLEKTLLVNEIYTRDSPTPLSSAKNVAMAKYLLDNGAQVNVKMMCTTTPLENAISQKNDPLVRLFIQRGATWTPKICFLSYGIVQQQESYDLKKRLFTNFGPTWENPGSCFLSYCSVQKQKSYDGEREELSTLCDIVSHKSFNLAVRHPESIFSTLPEELKGLIYSFYNVSSMPIRMTPKAQSHSTVMASPRRAPC